MLHVAENTAVVGNGRDHQMAAPECLGDHNGRMGGGHIIHGNVPYAPVRQHACQNIGRILRVAVNASVCDHHGLFLGRIAAPGQIFVHIPLDIRSHTGP